MCFALTIVFFDGIFNPKLFFLNCIKYLSFVNVFVTQRIGFLLIVLNCVSKSCILTIPWSVLIGVSIGKHVSQAISAGDIPVFIL